MECEYGLTVDIAGTSEVLELVFDHPGREVSGCPADNEEACDINEGVEGHDLMLVWSFRAKGYEIPLR